MDLKSENNVLDQLLVDKAELERIIADLNEKLPILEAENAEVKRLINAKAILRSENAELERIIAGLDEKLASTLSQFSTQLSSLAILEAENAELKRIIAGLHEKLAALEKQILDLEDAACSSAQHRSRVQSSALIADMPKCGIGLLLEVCACAGCLPICLSIWLSPCPLSIYLSVLGP
jgi:chromosome segregation ATPase